MEWLNYHHLLYFYTVAKEGGLAPAAEKLALSQPAISAQLRSLEASLGEKLFLREGRRLVLSDVGQNVYRYAEEIFLLGRDLLDSVRGRSTGRPFRLAVGVADVVPKAVAYRLLQPIFSMPEKVQLSCREDRPERLLTELALHQLDLVISDAPVSPWAKLRAFNHALGSCEVAFFGAPSLIRKVGSRFPACLQAAPVLMPGAHTALRRSLDAWFEERELRPEIVAEFDDSALMKSFGQAAQGFFAAPMAVSKEVCRQYQVRSIGKVSGVREEFFAISVQKKLKNPAVLELTRSARKKLF